MSEKAVGTDWKKRSIPTLRHAAGFKIPSSGKKKSKNEEEKEEESEEKRSEDGICIAIKKNGEKCRYRAKNGNYCGVHSR